MSVLNEKQKIELRLGLEQLEAELEDSISKAGENTKPVELDGSIGRVTRVDAMQQQSMAKANRELSRQKLLAVRKSLESLDNDDFGECRCCGEVISFARLLALPESQLCLECQEDNEQN